jgi:hypothetical protein
MAMKSNIWTYTLALAVFPFLPSCYFTSAHPLPPAPVDPALPGLWQAIPMPDAKDPVEAYLLIAVTDQRLWITIFEDAYRGSEMYLGYCSEVKGVKYLSVQRSKPDNTSVKMVSDDDFYLVRYTISPKGQLEIRLLNDEPFRKAVVQKKLSGEVSKDSLHLTASSEALASMLSRSKPAKTTEDDRLLVAVKIPLPAPPPKPSPTP